MEETLVAKYAIGTAALEQLNQTIADTRRAALSDSQSRAEIANLLGVQENELDAENPPFRADVAHASFADPEIFITLTAGRYAGRARSLWRNYIHARIRL